MGRTDLESGTPTLQYRQSWAADSTVRSIQQTTPCLLKHAHCVFQDMIKDTHTGMSPRFLTSQPPYPPLAHDADALLPRHTGMDAVQPARCGRPGPEGATTATLTAGSLS